MITFTTYDYKLSAEGPAAKSYSVAISNNRQSYVYLDQPSATNIGIATIPLMKTQYQTDVRELFPRVRLMKMEVAESIFKDMVDRHTRDYRTPRRGADITQEIERVLSMIGSSSALPVSQQLNRLLRSIEEDDDDSEE